jgi:asparagine synthase (glutamine-hydrolysing)
VLSTGFTIVAGRGAVEFAPYGARADTARRLLSAVQEGAQTVLVLGRLHYRQEPLQRVRGRVDARTWDRCSHSDAALAQACYRVDGVDGLCRLEGDFVLACHDATSRRLLVLRDPMGNYPVFWGQRGDTIAVSTSIRPLAERWPDVQLDPEYVADFLSFPYEFCAELPTPRTAYRGISRLGAGSVWEANLATGTVTSRPAWRWDEKVVPLSVRSLEEAGALVRERLEGAVRERLSRHADTASHFSGGFDSTGVALLAHRLGERPVHALSLTFRSEARLAPEDEYIHAALESAPGIVPHWIAGNDLLDYDAYDHPPLLDEPSVLAVRLNTFSVLARAAAEAGADTLMSGDGADHLFAHGPSSHVTECLLRGRVRQAWQTATRYSYAYSMSAPRIMIDALRPFLPVRLRDGVGPWLRGGRTSFDRLSERTIPPWLTEDFVRRHDVRRRILGWQYPLARSGFFTWEALAFNAGDWLNWYAGVPHGITMSRPYFDPRLLAVGLGLPRALHAQPGRMKPVLAAALHDVLPRKILTRHRKVHFGIFMDGMTRRQAALEALIHAAPIEDGILSRAALRDALARTALGIYDTIGVGRLRIALSYLTWLSTREAWSKLPVPAFALTEVCHDAAPALR